MSEYNERTRIAYDRYPEQFDEKFSRHFYKYTQNEATDFLTHLPGKRILDLGAGPGAHAEFFANKGFEVVCIDNSPAMISICRRRGLNAWVMDIEELTFTPNQFDGIWAYASLLHLPKQKIPAVIAELKLLLRPNGVIALILKEGTGEGFEQDEDYPDTQRWFSYFSEDEIDGFLANDFVCIARYKTVTHTNKIVFIKNFYQLN